MSSSTEITAKLIDLSAFDLALAGGLVLVAGVVSLAMRVRAERSLAIASLRTVAQLLLVGYALQWVFASAGLPLVLGLALLMVAAASRAAVSRPKRGFRGITWRAFLTLLSTGLLTSVAVTAAIVGVRPWYRPQYFIPLLGMILGNSLTGLSLCLDSVLEDLVERRHEIEMELSLGASRWEAARDVLARAIHRGMTPIVNTMMVVGIVSLPGMMTGQILAGADPLGAVKYQIVVMFMLAGATSLSALVMSLFAFQRCFNARHQLEVEHLRERGK